MKISLLLLAVFTLSLAACSGADAPPPPPSAAAQTPQPLPNSNIFKSDIDALNKAKNVQNIVDQGKANTDKQLQDAEGH